MKNNTWVIGDIHGHLEKLKEVLEISGFNNETDKLISIGDLCDRGPDSFGVVEHLMTICDLIHIRGNHDQWFIDFMDNDFIPENEKGLWLRQGGNETILSYLNTSIKDRKRHLDFYNKSIYYHIEDNKCFVHGGFDRNFKIEEHDGMSLMWDREFVNQMMSCKVEKLKTKDNFDKVFIGHTPTLNWFMDIPNVGRRPITIPINKGGVVNIDTGVCYGGKLTIMNIETEEYFQSSN